MHPLIVFDHANGEVRQTTQARESQRALRIEAALREVLEAATCFRTDDAERVVCDIYDIAAKALLL